MSLYETLAFSARAMVLNSLFASEHLKTTALSLELYVFKRTFNNSDEAMSLSIK